VREIKKKSSGCFWRSVWVVYGLVVWCSGVQEKAWKAQYFALILAGAAVLRVDGVHSLFIPFVSLVALFARLQGSPGF
jgi:hypothetical protein